MSANPLNYARLTVEGSPGGTQTTGIFEFAGNLEVVPGLRTGFLIGGRGSSANAVLADLLRQEESNRKGLFLDLGGGTREIQINFWGWEGAAADIDGDGTAEDLQWGDTGNAGSVSATDATGADPLTQMDVLLEYLATSEIDSRNPATLEYGEHHDGGLYEPLDVVVEGPQLTRSAQDGSWFTGQMTFLETVNIDQVLDGQQRPA